jgi:disulfide oxidoreductase YuzD
MVNIKKSNFRKFTNNLLKKKYCDEFNTSKDKQLKIMEPIEPEYVLFGLILVSFLPLNVLPKI